MPISKQGTKVSRRTVLLGAAASPFAFSILGSKAARADTVTMRVGSDSPIDDAHTGAAVKMKELIEAKTDGRIRVVIFPSGQVGSNEVMMNAIKAGALDSMLTDAGILSQAVAGASIFNLPFLFNDIPHAMRAANGKIGEKLRPQIESAYECEVHGWGNDGLRNMWNKKRPIKSPDDLHGMKMRVQANPIHQETYTALGALPTPISFTELYNALQTGVVDGADNSIVDIIAIKFYQVSKYISMTKHVSTMCTQVASKHFMASLSPADRDIVREASALGAQNEVQLTMDAEEKGLDIIKAKGMVAITDLDMEPFKQKMGPVYELAATTLGQALIDEAKTIS